MGLHNYLLEIKIKIKNDIIIKKYLISIDFLSFSLTFIVFNDMCFVTFFPLFNLIFFFYMFSQTITDNRQRNNF